MSTSLPRILEPEVMDTAEEAVDYDAMDHAAVNARFCSELLAAGPLGGSVLDVGTGTARIPIELCQRDTTLRVVAIDLATHMLALAAKNVAAAGLQDRIRLESIDAKRLPYADGAFETTISNSIVHHIPDPQVVFAEIHRVTGRGGLVFVQDLFRPTTDAEVDRLVALHAGVEPADAQAKLAFRRQRELLRASLKAALSIDEITSMAVAAGMAGCQVRQTSDRHWTLTFRKP